MLYTWHYTILPFIILASSHVLVLLYFGLKYYYYLDTVVIGHTDSIPLGN